MTTDHQMAMAYTAQQQVIVALRGIDEPDWQPVLNAA
jgi:hypothetical protein